MSEPDIDALDARYRAADYVIDDDPPIVLRIGERHDGIRLLMASFEVDSAVFVTAWNPASEPLSYDENIDRQSALLEDIESYRFNYFVGRGEDPEGGWAEDSYLVLGADVNQGHEIAARHEQTAFVFVPPSGVPELIYTKQDDAGHPVTL